MSDKELIEELESKLNGNFYSDGLYAVVVNGTKFVDVLKGDVSHHYDKELLKSKAPEMYALIKRQQKRIEELEAQVDMLEESLEKANKKLVDYTVYEGFSDKGAVSARMITESALERLADMRGKQK